MFEKQKAKKLGHSTVKVASLTDIGEHMTISTTTNRDLIMSKNFQWLKTNVGDGNWYVLHTTAQPNFALAYA